MLMKPITVNKFNHYLDLTNVSGAKNERKGVASPNLSVLGAGSILDYFQIGEYLPMWRLLEQVVHILLLVHLV